MVVKPWHAKRKHHLQFESRVILDGSQTDRSAFRYWGRFESRVILDGSQTILSGRFDDNGFESRVILDGSQTISV